MTDLPTILDSRGQPAALPPPRASAAAWGGGAQFYRGSQDTNQRAYRPAVDRDIWDLLPHFRHRALLSDARYIYNAGGGMVAGAVHHKADHVVGDAWIPRYAGEDDKFKAAAEPVIAEWCKSCDVRGRPYTFQRDVWLGCKALDVDGDFLIVRTWSANRRWPMLQILEAHRIGQRHSDPVVKDGRHRGKRIRAGVILNRSGRPVAYNILGDSKAEDLVVDAANVIHGFDPKWFSQARGIPAVAYSILDWYDVSEIREAEKIAVKVNSKLALIEVNKSGARDTAKQLISGTASKGTGGIQEEVIADGLIRYISAKGEIMAHESNRPGDTWEGFINHILRGAFAGLDWPIEAFWDMSGLTGSAVRAVTSQAGRAVRSRQAVLEPAFKSALLHGVAGLIEAGEIPSSADWYNWTFTKPARWSVDVGRDSQQARADYVMGVRNLTGILEEQGRSLEEHLRERAAEEVLKQEIAADYGIDSRRLGLLTPNGNDPFAGAATDGSDDTGDADSTD